MKSFLLTGNLLNNLLIIIVVPLLFLGVGVPFGLFINSPQIPSFLFDDDEELKFNNVPISSFDVFVIIINCQPRI